MSSSADIKPQITLDPPKPSVAENDDERLALVENLKGAMVWAVKVPRFLLERWERVPEAGIELGTLVVDNSYASGVFVIGAHRPSGARCRSHWNSVVPAKVTLRLPDTSVLHLENGGAAKKDEHDEEQMQEHLNEAGPSRRHVPLKYDTTGIPDEYEVNVPVERARNTWMFSERVRTWAEMGGGSSRAAQATGKRKREKGGWVVSTACRAGVLSHACIASQNSAALPHSPMPGRGAKTWVRRESQC
jgi:transcription initiation factor TFIIF subunit beta